MAEQTDALRGTRFLVVTASLVVIIYGINQAQSVVSLFLVSVFLALIGTPPVLWLERKHVGKISLGLQLKDEHIRPKSQYQWNFDKIWNFWYIEFKGDNPPEIENIKGDLINAYNNT
jgi:hypothetical protein